MKQVIISVVCIAILVIGGIAEIKYLNKSASYLSYDIEYIRNAINNDNYDFAKEQLNNTKKNWEAQKKIWHIFVNNEEIENIDESIVELEEYLNNQMKEEQEKIEEIPDVYQLDYSYNSISGESLPSTYDLRNVSGKNYITPF